MPFLGDLVPRGVLCLLTRGVLVGVSSLPHGGLSFLPAT